MSTLCKYFFSTYKRFKSAGDPMVVASSHRGIMAGEVKSKAEDIGLGFQCHVFPTTQLGTVIEVCVFHWGKNASF